MSSNLIQQPYPIILNPHGGGGSAKPAANAEFHVGEIDKDPVQYPRTDLAYRDESGTERLITSPIYTNNSGAFVASKNSSTIIQPYMKDGVGYSVLITGRRGEIYSSKNVGDPGNLTEKISELTDIVYKASGGRSAVENMVAGVPISIDVGEKCQCENGSIFLKISNSTGGTGDFTAVSALNILDFGDDNQAFIDLVDVAGGGVSIIPAGEYSISSSATGKVNLKGGGGLLKSVTQEPAVFCDGAVSDGSKIDSLLVKSEGVLPSSAPAYSAFFRDTDRPVVLDYTIEGYTGAVIATNTTSALFSDIYSKNNVYHPSLVAGGYGVLLQNANETITNNLHFYAGSGDDNGRHALYISRDAASVGSDFCQNTLSSNIIAKYENKDDRNFWGFNTRKSVNTVTSSFIIDGANGGVSLFPEDGVIKNHINANGVVKVEKYADGTAVYGVSQLATTDRVEGFIDSNLILEVKPKDGAGLSNDECIAYNLSGVGGMVVNAITNVPSSSSPFAIQGLCSNVLISNVVDIVDDGGTKEPMFSFVGAAADLSYDITIKNIVTNRPMFNYDRLLLIGKNITVDWIRTATMTSGVIDSNDHYIVERVAVGSSSLSVVFYPHVTEGAIESANIRLSPDGNVGSEVITSSNATELSIRFYDKTTGNTIDPSSVDIEYTVILDR